MTENILKVYALKTVKKYSEKKNRVFIYELQGLPRTH